MKRIIIVECPESAKDLPVKMVVFSSENLVFRAEKNIKEFIPPDEKQINKECGKLTVTAAAGFRSCANWFKSLLQ